MKSLYNYITESYKSFSLKDAERMALATELGFMISAIGDKADIDKYSDFYKGLTKEEIKAYNNIYDLLDNEESYPKINSRFISKEERQLLVKFVTYIDNNDLMGNNWDLMDAHDKIVGE